MDTSTLRRLWRHATTGIVAARRSFPEPACRAIADAVRAAERERAAQIRFVVEAALEPGEILAGLAPRARALEVFSELRMWDTERNDGVLIYLLLADRDVEIVADRGVARAVPQDEWDAVCREMEERFRAGAFLDGALAGIRGVAERLARHAPRPGDAPPANELPDAPVILP